MLLGCLCRLLKFLSELTPAIYTVPDDEDGVQYTRHGELVVVKLQLTAVPVVTPQPFLGTIFQ